MSEKGLERALYVARQFGMEAVANGDSFSSRDRHDIALYYGVESWTDIPTNERDQLLDAFREGEHAERKARDTIT